MTVVVLMGVATRARIAAALLARGRPAATPAAALFGASTPAAQAWFGDLLAGAPAAAGTTAPGCLCIGRWWRSRRRSRGSRRGLGLGIE